MAIPTNTHTEFDAHATDREDLRDIITNIDPFDTPFMSLVRSDTAEAAMHEWLSERLRAANGANAVIEGDDAVGHAITPQSRLRNTVQTSEETIIVSTFQDAVKKAGRTSDLARELMKAGKALKTDLETIITGNQARDTGSEGVARKLRGLEAWYATNVSRGAGGANGTDTTAATDGTQRPFSESLLKGVLQQGYTNGAKFSYAMFGPFNRTAMSAITGGATKFYNTQDKRLVATITVYDGDYHTLKIVPNRFTRDRTLHLIDPENAAVAWVESMQMRPLAVTGLTNKRQMWCSYTLRVDTERAHGVVADLTTT